MTIHKTTHTRRWRGLYLVLAFVASFTTLYHIANHQLGAVKSLTTYPSVDITSVLRGSLVTYRDFDFQVLPGEGEDRRSSGLPLQIVEFDHSQTLDVRTGRTLVFNEGTAFNLALARLPSGSEWDYVGVARGPTFRNDFVQVQGKSTREQTILGLGLKLGQNGKLKPVTQGILLDLPMFPNKACEKTAYGGTFGPEDPRVFWTDAGTVGLTFGRLASLKDICRNMGFIPDLRAIFPDLAEAMRTGVGVSAYESDAGVGEAHAGNRELLLGTKQNWIEKNWVSFYPGPVPNASAVFPHIHYKFAPDHAIRPITVQPRHVRYETIPQSAAPSVQNCIAKRHARLGVDSLHQATPFYRLTLCPRGCIPTSSNTVYLTVGHVRSEGPRYEKFFATYRVTEPYEPISVGPILKLNGTDDLAAINYAMTIQPITGLSVEDLQRPVPIPPLFAAGGVLPDHFFIDDLVLLTLGQSDMRMTSIVMEMREALGGHDLCQ